MREKKCPCGNGCMNLKAVVEKTVFKGVDLDILAEKYICPKCGIEAGTVKQAAAIQVCIADSYREKIGLLPGRTIKRMRSAAGLTKDQLAVLVGVSGKDIKGWESCILQTRHEDKTLRMVLMDRGSYEVAKWPELPDED